MTRSLQIALLFAPALVAQPPLIDRELFFATPEITGAQISPDGKYVTFLKLRNGALNLFIKRSAEPLANARPLTAGDKNPVSSYLWTRDAKFICYIKSEGQDSNLYAVDPAAPIPEGADAPPSRDLTKLKGATVQLYGASPGEPDLVFAGINDRDRAWPDLYKINAATAGKILIRENTDQVSTWFFDSTGRLGLAQRTAPNGDQEILRVEPNTIAKAYTCGPYETCAPLGFDKDGKRVYMISNHGDAVNLTSLVSLDPQTGKTTIVESDPLKRSDIAAAGFSARTGELQFTTYTDDRPRRYFKDKSFEADFQFIASKLPGREFALPSISTDEQTWLVDAFGDTEPGEAFVFDRQARSLTPQYRIQESLPREPLANMQTIRYKSSDGLEISGYLTVPKGAAANLPLLVIPHGGPWSRDVWGFNALAQLFANRGYAVLMPNFRGSTGHGKAFLNAADGEWGRKMQDDLTAGVQYLASKGTADPKRVAILGSAYGGYAALAGVAFAPDVFCAAVDISGPWNLQTMLASIPPTFEPLKNMMYARLADPATPAGKTWLQERSPFTASAKIKTPLLVVQGLRDPQVSRSESDFVVAGLHDRHVPVEYLLISDEGHSFSRPANRMAMLAASEKFLATYLKGRYQETAPPEVARRLAEITVDTEKLAAAVHARTISDAPALIADLHPGYYRYQTKLSLGGREMSIKTATIIEDKDGAWSATEIAETPVGTSMDTAILAKGTLTVQKRSLKQGQAAVDVEFSGGRAAGTISINGEERAIAADIGGSLFADAAGSLQAIGCLPLAEGYALTYRNFDLQRQKTKVMRLRVTGTETIAVPAGSFEAFVVEISSAEGASDKATVWIAKVSRQPIKILTSSSAMGGATMTSELLP